MSQDSIQSPSIHDEIGSDNKADDQPTLEEYAAALECDEEEEEEANVEECMCSFFDKFQVSKHTLEEFKESQLKETPLFANVISLDKDGEQICIERPSDDPEASILVTGFGMRNLKSLQNILDRDERKKLYRLYKSRKSESKEKSLSSASLSLKADAQKDSKRSIETETSLTSASSDTSMQQEKLRYLMGLQAEVLEEEAYPGTEELLKDLFAKEEDDKFMFSEISTTRSAQIYLRTHRIFDFFQFIIAHLLSAAPENPIVFILVLLNKMLLYRSGTGNPPLLYERKHVEELFRLMDRMNSGYIDIAQYNAGMNTLGICEYNKQPAMSEEGLVAREVFLQEALETETALFNDLIKRKWIGGAPEVQGMFSNITTPIRSLLSGFNLFPSELMLKGKHEKVEEENGEG